jgi:catechol 2,3-dioxygenase
MNVRVTKIGHVGIAVRDLDRTLDFYERWVGLRLTERFEYPEEEVGHGVAVKAGAFVRCDATHHCISFFVLKDELVTNGNGAPSLGLHHLAFEMATPALLLDKYREFEREGIEIVNARRGGPGNQPRFYVRDPDGNLLEFYWGIDTVGWDGRPREYAPIEEIDLESFDFDGFERQRDLDAGIAEKQPAA